MVQICNVLVSQRQREAVEMNPLLIFILVLFFVGMFFTALLAARLKAREYEKGYYNKGGSKKKMMEFSDKQKESLK